ncbi:MAG: hypothetical protein LBR32_10580 [Propionibacteriaceae bacterium]|jgi:hypothetical protein|nr:hypothetical protein [Propionibacteriaceae bacterium]
MTNTSTTPRGFAARCAELSADLDALRATREEAYVAQRQAQDDYHATKEARRTAGDQMWFATRPGDTDAVNAAQADYRRAVAAEEKWCKDHPGFDCSGGPVWSVSAHDARELAFWLKDLGLPGSRSMTAINRIRKERAANPPAMPVPADAGRRRLALKLRALKDERDRAELAAMVAEIERRGGETHITGLYETVSLDRADAAEGLTLLHAAGWRQYSRAYGARQAALSYLCGTDDAGRWAVRVPGTVTTVAAALDWLEPAAVKKARRDGKRVIRQGDVYAVETTKAHDGTGDLPDNHEWRPTTRYLVHTAGNNQPHHRPAKITWPVRFVAQRAYTMGRSGRRGSAD